MRVGEGVGSIADVAGETKLFKLVFEDSVQLAELDRLVAVEAISLGLTRSRPSLNAVSTN